MGCASCMGQTGWRSPPVPPHCPHIGRINLAPPWLLAGEAPAAATCSQSVRSYPPAPGVTMALGWAGSILTLQPSGDAGSPHTSARGGEEAWSYSQICSPRCLGPHPGYHWVIWCSGTCLAHPPAATTAVVVVLPHEPVCVLDMHMASVRAADTIRRSALSPALCLLMAVTPQPHHRGCQHPSPRLALATLPPAKLGLGTEPCLRTPLGRRRGCGAGASGHTEGMALLLFLAAYLARSPPAAPTRCGLAESHFLCLW